MGRFYSARHVLGFYRTTSALAILSFPTEKLPDPDTWFKDRFYQALYKTVEAHPSLCYGIVDQTADREAVFLRLKTVQRDDVVEFLGQDSAITNIKRDDLAVANLLETIHARILGDGQQKPAWRVVVLKHGSQWNSGTNAKSQRVSIGFFANHAIADGLSHINFHRTLLHFCKTSLTEECKWPYNVPRDLRTPILLEEVVDLRITDENDKSNINYFSPSIWSGANMFLPSVEDYESGLRFITVPQAEVKKVVDFCRSRKITLTGMLHGLLVAFLSKHVPEGHEFLAVTPYSMRSVSKVSDDEICNHASGLVHEFTKTLVSSLRSTRENSAEELDLIVEVGRIFGSDMTAELKRCPKK